MENDNINPSHYGHGKGVECIDVMMQQFGSDAVADFCKLNAFKYLFRMDHKSNALEDVKKAQWYLDKYLDIANSKLSNKH